MVSVSRALGWALGTAPLLGYRWAAAPMERDPIASTKANTFIAALLAEQHLTTLEY